MTGVAETFWEKGNLTRMGIYITTLEMDFLSSSLDETKNKDILDIGAGAGRFSIPLSEKGMRATSLDLDSHSLKRLKFKNGNVNVIQSDARVIPLKGDAMDMIVTVELVDVVHELNLVMEEIERILKPNGCLVFSFGNKSSFKGKLKSWRGTPYYHSYREVVNSLEKRGFTIVKRKGFNWLPFNRTSNSRLVPFMAKVERLFGLRKVVRYSPWVILYAVKSK